MTIAELDRSFYNIRGVEFVEHELTKGRQIAMTVGVTTGRFEAVLESQEDIDELLDIVEVHAYNSLSDKKRTLKFKFVPNNDFGV